ncbi:hypothetical protein [Methylomonas sp. AM2-LC]|uniref:hypothetical protein n=1 Tax=Methylomonas sp. AM2-LC TaxID=3153301 RepID=UPI0032671908
MISGVVMILAAIWVYQSLIKVKKGNLLLWVTGSCIVFFAILFLSDLFCIEIIDALNGKDIGGEYDPSLTDVGDRKTQEGAGGLFMPAVCELLPSILAFVGVAFIRTFFITKEALTPANLFSGLKELLISIKDSFKTTSN